MRQDTPGYTRRGSGSGETGTTDDRKEEGRQGECVRTTWSLETQRSRKGSRDIPSEDVGEDQKRVCSGRVSPEVTTDEFYS